jgi:ribosomal protein S18 acetylase RimI-like enzyme
MDYAHFPSRAATPAVVITRVAQRHWHALADDRVAGRGEALPRPDGRVFLSVDAWHGAVFDQLADAMLADLPRPVYTVVDEAALDLTDHWRRAGFVARRREWEFVIPTDPGVTPPHPDGVTLVGLGEADVAPLREVDRVIRGEIVTMPAEVLSRPDGITVLDVSRYAAAARDKGYVGLVRVTPVRQPRIGLIAVRADERRRGIARAMLANVLSSLHRNGIGSAWTEVDESNAAALALFEGVGARRASSNLELVLR